MELCLLHTLSLFCKIQKEIQTSKSTIHHCSQSYFLSRHLYDVRDFAKKSIFIYGKSGDFKVSFDENLI